MLEFEIWIGQRMLTRILAANPEEAIRYFVTANPSWVCSPIRAELYW